jgi:IclR helix-turn-helix domain
MKPNASILRDPSPRPGETPIARDFFAGLYAKVAGATFDVSGEIERIDVAFVVGALTFLGRVEDAQLCFDGQRLRGKPLDPRSLAASRFFLGVGYARAGDFDRAYKLLVQDVRRRARNDDPWVVAFVFQGLACQRYFTGRYRAAARHAQRALRAAHVARFGYVQMLANDLRGHALAQIGQYRAGISLLEQAKVHAERLDFGMNAYAIDCSIVNYTAEFVARSEALERIQALLGRRGHDSYSKRALLSESAIQLALRGKRTAANAALEEADADALRVDARRAKVTTLIARLHVLRWSRGAGACAELLEQTKDLLDEGDVAFRAEVFGFEAFVGRTLNDEPRHERALSGLRELARSNEHYRARAALEQFDDAPVRARAFPEDELTPLLRSVVQRDARVLHRLLALGLLGPVPELLGLSPAKRIVFLATENAALLEDHGDLHLKPSPPRWCAALLRVLASGNASKEAIVAALWGLRAYRPDRHDPLVRTTIHRLRTFLAPYGDWVVVTENGYGCKVPLHFVGAVDADLEAPLVEGEAPDIDGPSALLTSPASRRDDGAIAETPEQRVLEKLLHTEQRVGIRDLARAIGLSESTVLRALRVLVRKGRVVRTGCARATKYAARR